MLAFPPEHLVNRRAEPLRNLGPHPPENAEGDCKERERNDHVRPLQDRDNSGQRYNNRGSAEKDSWNNRQEKPNEGRPTRTAGLRCGEIAASALGTRFRRPRIPMPPGAELYVIRASAGVAKERLARRQTIAVETKFHGSSDERLDGVTGGSSPDGRPEAVSFDCSECREPKHFVRRGRRCRAERCHPLFGIRND